MKCYVTTSWGSLLKQLDCYQRDIYFREEYVRLYETQLEKAVALVVEDGINFLVLPILLREFDYRGQICYDFETPYGYGGPVCSTENGVFVRRAFCAIKQYGIEHNFVAGFIRFHPLLYNDMGFDEIGVVIRDRETVAMNTSLSEDWMWMNELHAKNRNAIRKGEKSGLKFYADYRFEYMVSLLNLYEKSMDEVHADSFYYFDVSYYERLRRDLTNCFLGTVWMNDELIAAAIFMYGDRFGHYHLAGSDSNYLCYSPNNFLLWNAAKEMHKMGIEKFHLGGGVNSDPHNSLLEFKGRFSKDRYQFSIGKVIFDRAIYDRLCQDWMLCNQGTAKEAHYAQYLLKYKY